MILIHTSLKHLPAIPPPRFGSSPRLTIRPWTNLFTKESSACNNNLPSANFDITLPEILAFQYKALRHARRYAPKVLFDTRQ